MIRFNQPRYIIPLILLPFIYVFYYLFDLSATEENVQEVEITSINPTLPDPFIDKDNLKDKFDAFQEAYKNNRKSSAIQEIDRREENTKQNQPSIPEEPLPVYTSEPFVRKAATSLPKRKKELDSYEAQMNLFKAQMHYVDSLIRVEEEGNRSQETGVGSQEKGDGSQKAGVGSFKQQIVKTKPETPGPFNTIAKKDNNTYIRAVIDEEIKVTKSSRVRLRLLDDIRIEQHQLFKGQFLFGVVRGFKPQRVEIDITSLLINGKILDVSLEIYDLDGMKGLYIPESRYRELTRRMGENITSSQQLPLDTPGGQQMQLMTTLAKDAINTTARTASRAIRKQKARLKYNTKVYLVMSNH